MALEALNDHASRQAYLLALLGPKQLVPTLKIEDWDELSNLAERLRLLPHLHGRLGRGELADSPPEAIAERWANAYRQTALLSLGQRAELLSLAQILAEKDIRCVALKGAFLAWHVYPSPAERPLRDLDLLVDETQAPAAYDILQHMGCKQEQPIVEVAETGIIEGRHLPALLSPSGVRIELHTRLWNRTAKGPGLVPPPHDPSIFENAEQTSGGKDSILYPQPADMLIHLIIHATYGAMRLDVGPLLLSDVDYLTSRSEFDWNAFRAKVYSLEIVPAAELVLGMVAAWRSPEIIRQSKIGGTLPPDIAAAATSLILQLPEHQNSAAYLSNIRQNGPLTGGLSSIKNGLSRLHSGGLKGMGTSLSALIGRVGQIRNQAADLRIKQTASANIAIGAWLETSGRSSASTLVHDTDSARV